MKLAASTVCVCEWDEKLATSCIVKLNGYFEHEERSLFWRLFSCISYICPIQPYSSGSIDFPYNWRQLSQLHTYYKAKLSILYADIVVIYVTVAGLFLIFVWVCMCVCVEPQRALLFIHHSIHLSSTFYVVYTYNLCITTISIPTIHLASYYMHMYSSALGVWTRSAFEYGHIIISQIVCFVWRLLLL